MSRQMHARSRRTVRNGPWEVPRSRGSIHTEDTFAVAVVDQVGLPIFRTEKPTTWACFVRIGKLLAAYQVARIGIEGSGHYGRCVAAYLA